MIKIIITTIIAFIIIVILILFFLSITSNNINIKEKYADCKFVGNEEGSYTTLESEPIVLHVYKQNIESSRNTYIYKKIYFYKDRVQEFEIPNDIIGNLTIECYGGGGGISNYFPTGAPSFIYLAQDYYIGGTPSTGRIPNRSPNRRIDANDDAICSGVTKNQSTGNGARGNIWELRGSTTSTINFPSGSIPTNFTILSLTRYTNATTNKARILNATTQNWLHGHHYGKGGCYYEGWKTRDPYYGEYLSGSSTDWLCCIGKNSGSIPNNILLNGIPSGTATGGQGNLQMCININGANSDFAFGGVIIWNRHLNNLEMKIYSDLFINYLNTGGNLNINGFFSSQLYNGGNGAYVKADINYLKLMTDDRAITNSANKKLGSTDSYKLRLIVGDGGNQGSTSIMTNTFGGGGSTNNKSGSDNWALGGGGGLSGVFYMNGPTNNNFIRTNMIYNDIVNKPMPLLLAGGGGASGTNNIISIDSFIADLENIPGTNDYIKKFTNIGTNTITLLKNYICDILIVAGGGGGGSSGGGGGGGGGLLYLTNINLNAGTHSIVVGNGGIGGNHTITTTKIGGNSSFNSYIAYGGGGGENMGSEGSKTALSYTNGGSGGGGERLSYYNTSIAGRDGGIGVVGQGNNGGEGKNASGGSAAGGGGGGAGAQGQSAFIAGKGGNGGIGREISITGIPIYYAGGGGGGSGSDFTLAGIGGQGGGGNGAIWSNTGTNGTNGLGGGGGGGSAYPGNGRDGGNGGSGIVIIRFKNIVIDTSILDTDRTGGNATTFITDITTPSYNGKQGTPGSCESGGGAGFIGGEKGNKILNDNGSENIGVQGASGGSSYYDSLYAENPFFSVDTNIIKRNIYDSLSPIYNLNDITKNITCNSNNFSLGGNSINGKGKEGLIIFTYEIPANISIDGTDDSLIKHPKYFEIERLYLSYYPLNNSLSVSERKNETESYYRATITYTDNTEYNIKYSSYNDNTGLIPPTRNLADYRRPSLLFDNKKQTCHFKMGNYIVDTGLPTIALTTLKYPKGTTNKIYGEPNTTAETATIPNGDWIEIELNEFIVPRGLMMYGGYDFSSNPLLATLPGSWKFYGKHESGDLYLLNQRTTRIREREPLITDTLSSDYVQDLDTLNTNYLKKRYGQSLIYNAIYIEDEHLNTLYSLKPSDNTFLNQTETAKKLIITRDESGRETASDSAIEFTFPKFKTFVLIFTSKAGTLGNTQQTCIALSEIKIIGGSITSMTSSTMD